jgi:diguanylate cyclase (GGDEF)-like protein/PAS domain S-box-containing protein
MIKNTWVNLWNKQPVASKFTFIVASVVFLAVTGLTTFFQYREGRLFQIGMEKQATLVFDSLTPILKNALQNDEWERLQSFSQELADTSPAFIVRFYDQQGQIIASSDQPSNSPSLQPDPFGSSLLGQSYDVFEWETDQLLAGRAISASDQSLGAMSVEFSLALIEPSPTAHRMQGIILALLVIGAGALLGYFLSRSITAPLASLIAETSQLTLTSAEPSYNVSVSNQDEIGALAEKINELANKLNWTIVNNRTILQALPDAIISFDQRGIILELNTAAEELLGLKINEAIGREVSDFIRPPNSDGKPHLDVLFTENEHPILDTDMETTVRDSSGVEFPVSLAFVPTDAAGPPGFTAIMQIIPPERRGSSGLQSSLKETDPHSATRATELTKANQALQKQMVELARTEQALRESEERYFLATRGANDGLWDWNLRTDEIYYSIRWKSILGYDETEILHKKEAWFGRVHPDDVDQLKADIATHLKGLTPHLESEHRILHKDGTYQWVLSRGLAVRDETGIAYRLAGSLSDITERKHVEEQLLHDAFHDALTGLPNRALFLDRLERAIQRSKRREDYLFAVLFLDLDRFKVINDSLGHTLGDQLLISVARRLEVLLRTGDTVARLGGDEFVILVEDFEEIKHATLVADRIQEEISLPFTLEDQKVFTTVSTGIVLSTMGYERPEDILRDADIAMYRAKELGRDRHESFDISMRAQAIARLELETDLRRAIGFQEFRVYYQPILSLATDQITGFEALVRWQHPTRGLIQPEDFISVAEETGLIIPIDWWVLREACHQLHIWQKKFPKDPPLTISVNVSSKHFAEQNLVGQVKNILAATSIEPHCLRLEITERVFMDNQENNSDAFVQLRDLGIQLQIDDFGTGYSSFGYLQHFPVDTIKIDKSFIGSMDGEVTNSEIVKTIVNLAQELKMDAIAEGVETPEQLDQLKDIACDFGQGYYISRPMDPSAVDKLIEGQITT